MFEHGASVIRPVHCAVGASEGSVPFFDNSTFGYVVAAEDMAVFVHALHPIAAKPLAPDPSRTAFVLFPIDVAMAAASLIMAGVPDRFPALRIGFSHGGGALGSILGRLEVGWSRTDGFGGKLGRSPHAVAARWSFDSNVYDPVYLRHLATAIAPGRVFAGTDYPYEIMQTAPVAFIESLGLDREATDSLRIGAASAFLAEDLTQALAGRA